MGSTTSRTQAAGHEPVSSIQPNQAGGRHPQAPPVKAFLGRPEAGFIFRRPEPPRDSIVVVTPFASEIQQSWYRCTWADPLPAGEADGPCGDISNP